MVDILAKDYDLCARFNGGANAGHSVHADGHKYAFHLLPCGILYPQCINLVGSGCVVNIPGMFEELSQLDTNGVDYKGRMKISTRAHLVSSIQMEADGLSEMALEKTDPEKVIGSTRKGIGPTYGSKALRIGLRCGDLADWDLFKEKYDYFIKRFKSHFPITEFD